MIFTIGHTENYLRYFAQQGTPQKKGRDLSEKTDRHPGGYCGGSVWKTREEAQAFASEGFSVFGVMAEWNTQTSESLSDGPNVTWRDLLVDAALVIL